MKILLNSDIPIYKQISADFKERIMNGEKGHNTRPTAIHSCIADTKPSPFHRPSYHIGRQGL